MLGLNTEELMFSFKGIFATSLLVLVLYAVPWYKDHKHWLYTFSHIYL